MAAPPQPEPAPLLLAQRDALDPSPEVRDESLRRSVWDGCAHALMLGVGEAYLAPYAIVLGANSLVLGLLASAPLFLGSLAQLSVVKVLDRLGARRPLVVIPALLQAVSFLPIFVLPLLVPSQGAKLLLFSAFLYFVAGSAAVPPWNSWMGDLVLPHQRGEYFGRRERLRTGFQLAGILLAGAALSTARGAHHELWGFGAIFGVALAARVYSAAQIQRMAEPVPSALLAADAFTLRDFLKRSPRANFGRFTLYAAAFLGSTHLAAPFFTPYMLGDLSMSYVAFTASSVSFVLTQAVTLHNWGKVGDRFGNRRVLALTGLLLPFIPMLWLLSTHVAFICLVQAISGVVWGGFLLSVANFIFDAVTPAKRARCVAYYNTLTTAGILAGASLGGWLAPHLPTDLSLLGMHVHFASRFQGLFLLSGLARLFVSLLLLPVIREVRPVEPSTSWQVITHVVGLAPIRGVRINVFSGVHPTEIDAPTRASERGEINSKRRADGGA